MIALRNAIATVGGTSLGFLLLIVASSSSTKARESVVQTDNISTQMLETTAYSLKGFTLADSTNVPNSSSPCYVVLPDGSYRVLTSVCSKPSANQSAPQRFLAQSKELEIVFSDPALLQGGGAEPVVFDAKLAAQKGISQKTIKLAQEMADYTNALRAESQRTGIQDVTQLDVVLKKYPNLSEYFKQAEDFSSQAALPKQKTLEEAKSRKLSKINDVSSGSAGVKQVGPVEVVKANHCGAFWNPRPSRGAPWINHNNVRNPASTLSSWGYHETPGVAGAGWTRPRTFDWWICGWNTYRDHAYVNRGAIREQKYNGWSPNGEPNPEVWRSGPWPYAVWPAYVRWWHSRF